MGDEARARRLTAIARKWLVDPRVGYSGDLHPAASERQELSCMVMAGARVSLAEPGRVVCSLSVRAPLTVRVCPQPRHAPAPSIRALV
jgi:acyl-coenzyme A thioesterase 13